MGGGRKSRFAKRKFRVSQVLGPTGALKKGTYESLGLGGEVTTGEVTTISGAVVLIGTKPTVRACFGVSL